MLLYIFSYILPNIYNYNIEWVPTFVLILYKMKIINLEIFLWNNYFMGCRNIK